MTTNLNIYCIMAEVEWFHKLLSADKVALVGSSTRKIHYKFENGEQMIEEYNLNTGVLTKRAWKSNKSIRKDDDWEVEIGDSWTDTNQKQVQDLGIKESQDTPFVTHRLTKTKLEWRIRNIPYPEEYYNISVDSDEKCVVVRTINRKFFKKLPMLDFRRLNLKPSQSALTFSHFMNTLVITYEKPPELIEFEKKLAVELKKVQVIDNGDLNCNPS